ncbi:hypothetical protein Lalb_Chr18g0045751 [Lupinus albus]|uniref:Uncharacterized protein n=1 Tax=Lupinus albus TaxID=3870 RepID=A0A6A4NWG0_LUPAL|nr:hypothetical protein Lalb_Chr18g0045751 [Lupinus albus]
MVHLQVRFCRKKEHFKIPYKYISRLASLPFSFHFKIYLGNISSDIFLIVLHFFQLQYKMLGEM